MRKRLSGNLESICFVVAVLSLTLLTTTQIIIVTAQEEELFSWSGNLDPFGTNKQHFSSYLKASEKVRLVLSAPETVKVYIHSSDDYQKSEQGYWIGGIWSHWSSDSAEVDYTYTIPFTDTWYFTVYNYKLHNVYVNSFAGYKVIPTANPTPNPTPSPNPPEWLLIMSGLVGAVIASGIVTFYFLKVRKRSS